MAMVALGVPGVADLDLKILATDIAVDTLRQAEAGVYAADRVEPVPPALRSRWFTKRRDPRLGADLYEVSAELKRRVVYRRLNLTAPPFPMSGPLDVVFCRNVLIYFDQPTRQRLIGGVEGLLAPGGLLCLGHTETLSGVRCALRMERPSVFRRAAERA
jgi:chemotaxis protein methyltransferase CheR